MQVKVMERVTGIGPVTTAWEAVVLPLNYTRVTAFFFQLIESLFLQTGILRLAASWRSQSAIARLSVPVYCLGSSRFAAKLYLHNGVLFS